MNTVARLLVPLAVLLLLAGCDSRIERNDGGGVALSVSEFDGLPAQVSVNQLRLAGVPLLVIESITIESIVRDLTSPTSDLQNIEMSSYQVTFSRGDGGTLLPPPLVERIFGVTPVGGTNTYDNLTIVSADQFDARPLSDYYVENGGFDRETGRTTTNLNLHIQFFGRSLAGEAVASNVASFTVKFTV